MKFQLVFLIALLASLLSSCSTKEAQSDVLEERAGYNEPNPSFGTSLESLHQSEMDSPQEVSVWVHGYRLPTGDYFEGSSMRLKIDDYGVLQEERAMNFKRKKRHKRLRAQKTAKKRILNSKEFQNKRIKKQRENFISLRGNR